MDDEQLLAVTRFATISRIPSEIAAEEPASLFYMALMMEERYPQAFSELVSVMLPDLQVATGLAPEPDNAQSMEFHMTGMLEALRQIYELDPI